MIWTLDDLGTLCDVTQERSRQIKGENSFTTFFRCNKNFEQFQHELTENFTFVSLQVIKSLRINMD